MNRQTNRQTYTLTDDTKRIISPALWLINIPRIIEASPMILIKVLVIIYEAIIFAGLESRHWKNL